MAKLFLSYRRSDCGPYADRLAGRLRAFQFETVFLDRDGIRLADDYSDRIRSGLSQASAVLVLIGKGWIDARDDAGRRRLDDPSDWVRREVELAMSLGLPVIPVAFDHVRMPGTADLPLELAPLATRQGYDISQDYFDRDADDLARRLEKMLAAVSRSAAAGSGAPVSGGVLSQLRMIWIGLFFVTVAAAILPAFVPAMPDLFWPFPGLMTLAAFVWWLYASTLTLRPAGQGTA